MYINTLKPNIVQALTEIVGSENISSAKEALEQHAKDKSFHNAFSPAIVMWPQTTQQVSKILVIANMHCLPVTAWGGGSSLEGNPIPVDGGIVVNMTKMNKLIQIIAEDLQAKIQPGIIGEKLDELLKPYGLWFAAAPGSKHLATIGGMIANNAGGMHAVKYGVVGDAVLELEVVLASGDIIRVGSKSFKSVAGYDLKRLFIGSEGTLGIITEAVLRLTPLPEAKTSVIASFSDNVHVTTTTLALLRSDIKPASIEFMDKTYVSLVNKAKKTTLLEQPTILVELHGNRKVLSLQLSQVKNICHQNNATAYQEFITDDELTLLWQYRRAVRPVLSTLLPNTGVLSAEVGVPISQVPKLLQKAEEVSKKYSLQTVMFGHIGDGNFHGWALYELNNDKSWKTVTKLNEELIRFAIEVGGTTTGEHGLGIGKSKFLPLEHPTSIELMKKVKQLFDPKGILNPGKMFPEES